MKLRNVNPLGHIDLPLIGRVLEPRETFEVPDAVGKELLKQVGNYELAEKPATPAKKASRKQAAPKTPTPASGHESVSSGTSDPKETKQ